MPRPQTPGSEANPLSTVTVIIPAYNAELFLTSTLQSILDQTYRAWSVIVVDDGSTDRTREIVSDFAGHDDRFALIALEKNHGAPAGPRNRGVAAARASGSRFSTRTTSGIRKSWNFRWRRSLGMKPSFRALACTISGPITSS